MKITHKNKIGDRSISYFKEYEYDGLEDEIKKHLANGSVVIVFCTHYNRDTDEYPYKAIIPIVDHNGTLNYESDRYKDINHILERIG